MKNHKNWKNKVYEMYTNGGSYDEMAQELRRFFPELTNRQRYDKARKYVIRHIEPGRKVYNMNKDNERGQLWRTEQRYKEDGTQTIKAMSDSPVSVDSVLKSRGLNPSDWAIVNAICKDFQKTRNGKTAPVYETNVTIRPKTLNDITPRDLKKIIPSMDKTLSKPSMPMTTFSKSGGKVGEVLIADPHIGLKSLMSEVGKEYYNVEIAFSRARICAAKIVKRLSMENVDKIRLVTLGDILHVDNAQNTTTNGTLQNLDGTAYSIVPQAAKFLKIFIDALLTLEKPVEYVYIEGNHDRLLGFAVAGRIEEAYSSNPLFSCDTDPKPIKIRVDGSFVNAYHHGDANIKNLSDTPVVKIDDLADNIAQDNRFAGMIKFVKVGHLHHSEDKTRGTTTICYQPTICGHSHWEYGQAFGDNIAGMKCYIYDTHTLDNGAFFVSAIN